MIKYFTNTYPIINLYKRASKKSEIVTQMIYGDSFSIIRKTNNWIKVIVQIFNSSLIQNRRISFN